MFFPKLVWEILELYKNPDIENYVKAVYYMYRKNILGKVCYDEFR